MRLFWTITNLETQFTNDRSIRFPSEQAAINAANARIVNGRAVAVVVLKSIKIVRMIPNTKVEDLPTQEQEED